MSDPRQNVRPGQRLQLAAAQVNFLNSLMRQREERSFSLAAWDFTGNFCLAKNDTGNDLARWGVMKIDGLVIDPSANNDARAQWEAMPCILGATATPGQTAHAVVAVEPIPVNKIGRVAVGGVVQVATVDITKINASIVLWKNDDWALIRFGGETPLRLCKTTGAFDKGTTATLDVWEDCGPPGEAQSVGVTLAGVVNKYADIPSDRFVSVARHGNGYWYVVAAECA